MAEIKKYLDLVGAEHLVDLVKAEDVKVKEAANAYADSLAKNYDAAGAAATAEANAKAHADQLATGLETKGEAAKVQGKLDEEVQARKDADTALQGSIDGVSAVANKNKEDIAAINNEETGILAQAKADAKAKADAVQGNVDALAGKVGEVPEGSTVMSIIGNIQENAYDDTELRGLISGLDTNKADKTQVATDIADAVKVEEDARKEAVKGVQDAVDELADTHATDKKALEDAIALKADKSALDEVSGVANAAATKVALEEEANRAKGEEARIEGLIGAETERATGVEADFEERIAKMEVFWDTTEDADGVVNKLKEIQDYIASDESGAATMAGNIQKNTQAISDMDAAYKAADTTLQGNIDALSDTVNGKAAQSDLEAVEGRMDDAEGAIETVEGRLDVVEPKVTTLEGKMTTVEGAVETKVEQEAYNTKIAALEGVDADLDERLQLVEAQLGDGENSVSDLISDAEQRAKDDATTKANTAESNAKAHADGLNTAMNARVEALEAIDHEHTNKAELDKIAEGDKAKWDAAAEKAHEHTNAAELAKIADGDVAKWNASEQNAKDYADGLNNAMTTKVDGIDGRVKTVEGAVATKAEDADLDALAERVTTAETNIANNTAAINAFVKISNEEIEALFA